MSAALSEARAIAIQADGKIVFAGVVQFGAGGLEGFGLARYNPDGALDENFGNGGKVQTGFPDGIDALANALALQTDGKIVVGGGYQNFHAGDSFALARYSGHPFDSCSAGLPGRLGFVLCC